MHSECPSSPSEAEQGEQIFVRLHARHMQLCQLKALRASGHDQEAQVLAAALDLEDQTERWAQQYSL